MLKTRLETIPIIQGASGKRYDHVSPENRSFKSLLATAMTQWPKSLMNSLTLSVKTQLKKFTRWQMNGAMTSDNHLLWQGAISLHNNFHLDPSIVMKSKR